MPELAEVQSTAEGLRPLLGERVKEAEVMVAKWARGLPLPEVVGSSLCGSERWGKRILWTFSDGKQAVISLGMSGSARLLEREEELPSHTMLRFRFSSGRQVAWRDPRRFGNFRLYPDLESAHQELDRVIGPDAYQPPPSLALFQARLGGSRAPIKARLLDQARLSGIGNYLAVEMLAEAGIHPARPAGSLQQEEWERLHSAGALIISRALQAQGLTLRDYRGVRDEEGGMAQLLRVYGRAGLPCLNCARPLVSGVVAGRGTVWCVDCQPLKPA